jgi:hypothetical protein
MRQRERIIFNNEDMWEGIMGNEGKTNLESYSAGLGLKLCEMWDIYFQYFYHLLFQIVFLFFLTHQIVQK